MNNSQRNTLSAFLRAGGLRSVIPVKKEPSGLAHNKDGKRLDGCTSLLGVEVNHWLGMSQFAPQWPIHT